MRSRRSVATSAFSQAAERLRRAAGNDRLAGIVLLAAALLGLIAANSPLHSAFEATGAFVPPVPPALHLQLSLEQWIESGLMAVFFFGIGLEIKAEVRGGELSSRSRAALPLIAACGGVVVPAVIFFAVLHRDPIRMSGWAIPVATDIAFALAALSLARRGLPPSLRPYVTAIAAIDDVIAIAIIATFYTRSLALDGGLIVAACCLALLAVNRARVVDPFVYATIGIVLWYGMLRSGVHATLAGVILAAAVPSSHVARFEAALTPWIAFGVLPLFGFFAAGVSMRGVTPGSIGPMALTIALALIAGKQIGIFGATWLAIRTRVGAMPEGANWTMLYGVALLGGIGFTMSLFVATLAFPPGPYLLEAKIGIFTGSIVSALAGIALLRASASITRTRRAG